MPRLEGIMALRGAQHGVKVGLGLMMRSTLFDLPRKDSNLRQGG
jgi:hypothetical protein